MHCSGYDVIRHPADSEESLGDVLLAVAIGGQDFIHSKIFFPKDTSRMLRQTQRSLRESHSTHPNVKHDIYVI